VKIGKENVLPDLTRVIGVLTITVSAIVLGMLSTIEGWWVPVIIGLIIYIVGEKMD